MRLREIACLLAAVSAAACGPCVGDNKQSSIYGFLENPPLYVLSQPDMPLTDMGIDMPAPGATSPNWT